MTGTTRPSTLLDRSRWLLLPSFLIVVTLLALTARVRTDDPVSSNVRYTGEIVRILDRRCAACHSTNSVAKPLSNYREVREWGRSIREEIVEQRMPPWSAARGYARFQHDLALTARETATMLSWLDGGMPRGDDRDLPASRAAGPDDPPDLLLPLAPQAVAALDEHVVRRVTVETHLPSSQHVARVAIGPASHRVLRGAFVFVDQSGQPGQWIGAWLPWQPRIGPPGFHGFLLAAGSRLIVELHYRGDERPVEDRPVLELYFTDERSANATAVAESIVSTDSPVRIAAGTKVWALVPVASPDTSSLEVSIRRPNGAMEILLWIPEYRHDWPQVLVTADPVALEPGTTIRLATEPHGAAARVRLSLLPAGGAAQRGADLVRPLPPAPVDVLAEPIEPKYAVRR